MNAKKLLGGMGLTIVLFMAGVIGWAEAREIPLDQSFSGSGATAVIDTNGDGVKASLVQLEGAGGLLGPTTTWLTSESLPPLATPVTCPVGNLEFPLLLQRGVVRVHRTGDLFFFNASSGTSCIDPTGTFSLSFEEDIIGGTGAFEGATGSFEVTVTGTTLVRDPSNNTFSGLTGTATGTIITTE